jgi:hypothetical protein
MHAKVSIIACDIGEKQVNYTVSHRNARRNYTEAAGRINGKRGLFFRKGHLGRAEHRLTARKKPVCDNGFGIWQAKERDESVAGKKILPALSKRRRRPGSRARDRTPSLRSLKNIDFECHNLVQEWPCPGSASTPASVRNGAEITLATKRKTGHRPVLEIKGELRSVRHRRLSHAPPGAIFFAMRYCDESRLGSRRASVRAAPP